ncbi:MAG TPA: MotA/TolQ/ExbB proton channel family protein [Chthoniobacter sp.]|nr:MotA/TolQ/ExbB proton channel family protein [Chthoniobacter sp.]
MEAEHRERGKALAVVGAVLQLGPVIGVMATSIGMLHSFGVLAQENVSDPRALAGKMGEVLIFTLLGFLVGLIGLILIFVALVRSQYRARWLYWILVADGFLYQIAFPIGSLVGIGLLVYCFTHRAEFLKPRVQTQ